MQSKASLRPVVVKNYNMGAQTKAIIRKDTSLKDLSSYIEEKYKNVIVRPTEIGNYFFCIQFDTLLCRRSMNCFFNNYATMMQCTVSIFSP